jgi:hypothetical protein
MKFIFLWGLLFSASAFAEFSEPSTDDMQTIIQRIQQVHKTINPSSALTKCDPNKDKSCSFNDMCNTFLNKGQNYYLFKDDQGRSIANFQLLNALQTAEKCVELTSPPRIVNDPFNNFDQMYSKEAAGGAEQLQKNRELLGVRYSQTLQIFSETQNRVLKIIKRKKTLKNQNEIDNLIKRIESIRLEVPRDPDDLGDLAKEGCEMPNAVYEPMTHSITLCPQLLNLPESSLMQILAHEMGHSIDPCISGFAFDNKGILNNEGILGPPDDLRTPSITEIPAGQHPFKSIVSCLKEKKSMGVATPKAEDLLSQISETDEDQEPPSQAIKNLRFLKQEDESALLNKLPSLINCGFITENGHMQEAFSDWLGAEVLAGKITETIDRKKANEYALSAKAFFASLDCDNLRDVARQKLNMMVENKCILPKHIQRIQDSPVEIGPSSHPKTSDRINRIFLANPKIRQALGCQQSSELKHCQ